MQFPGPGEGASLLALKGVAVAVLFAALFLAERLAPAAAPPRAEKGGWRRVLRNLALFALNAGLSPLLVVPLTAAAAAAAPLVRPEWWGGAPAVVLDLVVLDLFIWLWHRANHEVPLLWRFHEVHHRDRFLDTTTAVRFHAGEVVLSATARAALVLALAIPLATVLAFEALLLAAALFQHSNLKLPPRLERALSRVIVTPSIHWVHHHRVRADTDSNYATVLSLWDPLFRTRSGHVRTKEMEIGAPGVPERGLLGLLAAPFRSRPDQERPPVP